MVYPGVMNGDNKEEIKVMANVKEKMQIETGNRIAQVLFPYTKGKATSIEGSGAFVSTGNHVLAKNIQLSDTKILGANDWCILR